MAPPESTIRADTGFVEEVLVEAEVFVEEVLIHMLPWYLLRRYLLKKQLPPDSA